MQFRKSSFGIIVTLYYAQILNSMTNILDLPIKKTFCKALPADMDETNRPRKVEKIGFSYVNPTPTKNPQLITVSEELLNEIGISDKDSEDFLNFVSGQKNHPMFRPYAMRYGGHQFGHWAGQLGDGRAINIAEFEIKEKNYVFQLKGAGLTPYSRTADGLAVLRSSIREFLMSEAMHFLGIATTRALSLSLTGDEVLRDVLYNGNPAYEKGAVVCRVAESFVRFGNFEILAAYGEVDLLRALTNHIMDEFHPMIKERNKEGYLDFFKSVADKSLDMVLNWQRVGFVHGVMNTDNMSILGLTIDYGPYGWLEDFNPGWTPNTTDRQNKRYRFGNQPSIVLWNLTQLANALFPLIEDVEALQSILEDFKKSYFRKYQTMMLSKLGIYDELPDDAMFLEQLEGLLFKSQIDYVRFFRKLSSFKVENSEDYLSVIKEDSYLEDSYLEDSLFDKQSFQWENWIKLYKNRLVHQKMEDSERMQKMNEVNPKYVLRNYMAHMAIEAADKGDYSVLNELQNLLKKPYEDQPSYEKWFGMRPEWAMDKVGCSMLSCSS